MRSDTKEKVLFETEFYQFKYVGWFKKERSVIYSNIKSFKKEKYFKSFRIETLDHLTKSL